MRHRLNPILALALASTLMAAPAVPVDAAPGGQASPARPNTQTTFAASGINVGGHVIRPGEALPIVFGVAGPPDQVRAMRSKQEKDDYVMFSYYSQGFSLDINSRTNQIQGILIETADVKVDGVPFKVGESKEAVMKGWGQPDRTENGVLAYWRRGVYVGVDEAGRVINLFLAPPGKVDDVDRPADRVGG